MTTTDATPETDQTSGDQGSTEPQPLDLYGENDSKPDAEGTPQATPEPTQSEFPQTVKVTVDGQEIDVPFNELKDGYLRQSDYTRKTQEVAEQRHTIEQYQQLVQALETDPQRTLDALKEVYGANDAPDTPDNDYDLDDPVQREIAELKQWKQAQEDRQLFNTIEQEIGKLQQTYDDFNPDEILNYASQNQIMNLDAAYRAWKYDQLQIKAREQYDAERQNKDNAALDAKRKAQIVEGGHSPQRGAVTAGGEIKDIADAFEQASAEFAA